jgi:hypothetical protein
LLPALPIIHPHGLFVTTNTMRPAGGAKIFPAMPAETVNGHPPAICGVPAEVSGSDAPQINIADPTACNPQYLTVIRKIPEQSLCRSTEMV